MRTVPTVLDFLLISSRRAHARALTTACAKASADCGFCPVTRLPETTTCDVQGSPLLYLPPLPARPCSFDPEKGLTASV